MGLFSRFASKENQEAPKQEKKVEDLVHDEIMEAMEPTNAERGREIVDKTMRGAKELWSKMTGKLSSFSEGVKDRAKDLLFKGVGFIEKDIKDTARDVKSVYNYVAESDREAGDIARKGLETAIDFLKNDYTQTKEDAKSVYNKAVEIGYTGAALAIIGTEAGYKMAVDLGKKGIDLG